MAKESSSVWHPNTQMSEWDEFGSIVEAKGMWLTDSKGRRMMDAVASMWCNVWGHSDPDLIGAMREQAGRLQHSPLFNLTHEPAEQLADGLVGISPGMHRVFYTDNGSSAMEVAVKMALQCNSNKNTGRHKLASLENGYHGDTFGAMSVGYIPEFFGRFRSHLFDVERLPAPRQYRLPAGFTPEDYAGHCLDAMEKVFARDETAALIMESGAQMAGGALVYPEGFQRSVSRLCSRHGVLLVLDEIASGFGRLGSMAQYVAQDSRPDVIAYGKMMTGGYLTMAATLATKKVYDSFLGGPEEGRHLFHGHTYTGNPVAAAVACRNLEMYGERDLIGRIARTSRIFGEYAGRLGRMRLAGDVRHKGMMMGIEMVSDKHSKDPIATTKGSINRIFFELGRRHGLYIRTLGNILLLVPPLAISEEELAEMLDRASAMLKSAETLIL